MGLFAFVIGGVAVAPLAWAVVIFNRLVRLRNQWREAWSGVDVQLKRRHDLVPELIECVRGYRDHERNLLANLTEARSQACSAQGAAQAGKPEGDLASQLRLLFAVAEAYPDLKANQNFQALHASLVEIEDQLQYARRYYNGAVRDYNTLVESFPSQMVARLFGFRSAVFFEVESAVERQAQEVRL
jgi:LemA protein